MPLRTLVTVIVSKLVIVPAANLGLIILCLKTGLLPRSAASVRPFRATPCESVSRPPSGRTLFFSFACSSSALAPRQ